MPCKPRTAAYLIVIISGKGRCSLECRPFLLGRAEVGSTKDPGRAFVLPCAGSAPVHRGASRRRREGDTPMWQHRRTCSCGCGEYGCGVVAAYPPPLCMLKHIQGSVSVALRIVASQLLQARAVWGTARVLQKLPAESCLKNRIAVWT